MPERRIFPEFRDEYAGTLYPFLDTASLICIPTGQQIDRDLFLDAALHPIGVEQGALYISNINIQSRRAHISIADRTRREKASVTFDPVATDDVLRLTDDWGRPAGVLVSDPLRLARFSAWAFGDHKFEPEATMFVPSCVIPTPEVGVRGILTEAGDLFTGDVLLVGDNGVIVRQDGENPDTIRVDIVGDPLFLRKLCEPISLFTPPNFIRTINGCPPDEYGNFHLVVGDHLNDETIVRIYAGDQGLVIEAVGNTVARNGN
jgi:hypothetical protein